MDRSHGTSQTSLNSSSGLPQKSLDNSQRSSQDSVARAQTLSDRSLIDMDNGPCPHRQDGAATELGDRMGSTSSKCCGYKVSSARRLALVLSVVLWVSLGITVLCRSEGLHVLSATYILVQMITTIGYGDIAVHGSDSTKVFLSFYVLFCCVILGGTIMTALNDGMHAAQESIATRMSKLKEDASDKKDKKHLTPLVLSLIIVMVVLVAGTVFFAVVEKCTCSYGKSVVDGCDAENCEATGGYTKSVLDAWYMSCVTLTTIGFGDVSPKSMGGRIFSLIWMLGGVVAMMNFVAEFSNSAVAARNISKQLELDINSIFSKIDTDDNGTLDRLEFLVFALLEYGLLSEEDLDAINAQFDNFDQDGNGTVTKEEICERYGKVRQAEANEFNESVVNRATATMGLNSKLCPRAMTPATLSSRSVVQSRKSDGICIPLESTDAVSSSPRATKASVRTTSVATSDGEAYEFPPVPRGPVLRPGAEMSCYLRDVAVQVTPEELLVEMPMATMSAATGTPRSKHPWAPRVQCFV